MIFGDITTGPSNDLQVATALARAMVTRWGMSDTIGPIALESDGGKTLFGSRGVEDKDYSERVSALIDGEVEKIMKGSLKSAEETLATHKKALDLVADKLMEVETLEQESYDKLIIACGIVPKKPVPQEAPIL
jgi:cell division protease FtsH